MNHRTLAELDAVLILAGGRGSRMLGVGKTIPKFLLPIFDRPLLEIQLQYLAELDFKGKVIISTRDELVINLQPYTESYPNLKIEILNNPAHSISVVDAFYAAVVNAKLLENFSLLLSDIYFPENPFKKQVFEPNHDTLVGMKAEGEVLNQGGIIALDKKSDKYRIIKQPDRSIENGTRWSGMAICGKGFQSDFEQLSDSRDLSGLSLEDVFAYRAEVKGNVNVIDSVDFVNINTPNHFLLANLMQKAHTETKNSLLHAYLTQLEQDILSRGEQI